MDKRDAEIIVRLAKEGKQISKIWEEDFPEYDYIDIYWEVYGAGERSALGTKRMITNRLHKLTTVPKREQQEIIDEINELVSHMYTRYRESQKKLDEIRGVINR
jgi:radical SAM superfamily enzyme with C-terminal helix-hairpin-helix motif